MHTTVPGDRGQARQREARYNWRCRPGAMRVMDNRAMWLEGLIKADFCAVPSYLEPDGVLPGWASPGLGVVDMGAAPRELLKA